MHGQQNIKFEMSLVEADTSDTTSSTGKLTKYVYEIGGSLILL